MKHILKLYVKATPVYTCSLIVSYISKDKVSYPCRKNQIIMLDEAHNVEDISRRSASLESQLEARNLDESMADFNAFLNLNQSNEAREFVGTWKNYIESVVCFLQNDKIYVNMDKRDQYTVVELERMTQEAKRDLWLDRANAENLKNAYKGLIKHEITSRVRSLMDGVVRAYDYITKKKNAAAYRVLVKKEPFNPQTHAHLVRLNKKNDTVKEEPDFYHELQ